MEKQKIKDLVSQMTLEEKAGFCTGRDFWNFRGVERLDIPPVLMTDGPHGLRKQIKNADHLGLSDSKTAICFPTGSALASSFSRESARRMGEEYGTLAHAEEVSVVLGPSVNIKRSPLCGRNFEYYSEDPCLTSELAKDVVEGIQSKNVGACMKHFAANNQEYRRLTSNSVVDERTMREIYLEAFEHAVKAGKPWAVMSAYNKVNGVYASEHRELLTDILREEWEFDGIVISDWGAADDPVASVLAGLDVEMPGPCPDHIRKIVAAAEEGRIPEKMLDALVERVLDVRFRYLDHAASGETYDFEKGHETARILAADSAVLLKNEGGILPLKEEENILLVGEFAKEPRYQGGGSSHIHAYRVSSACSVLEGKTNVEYRQGYSTDEERILDDGTLEAAAGADKVVIFAGVPEVMESEGFDRKDLELPLYQNRLIEEVVKVQPNTIVVLHNGSPVTMPWLEKVRAVLEMYLGGEAVGEATVDLLYGRENPSGRLAETFPLKIEDTPAYPYYGKEKEDIVYREGIMVGYRHYTTRKIPVLYPFGYGLSYTEFEYTDLKVDQNKIEDTQEVTVSVDVKNIGKTAGKEVVQLYVSADHKNIVTPLRELRDFRKILLQPGEKKTVTFTLGKRAFAYWSEDLHDWDVPTGCYQIQIGRSSEEILLSREIQILSTRLNIPVFTRNSAIGDVLANENSGAVMMEIMAGRRGENSKEKEKDNSSIMSREALAATMDASPIRSMLSFNPNGTAEQLEAIVQRLNQAAKESTP